MKYPLLNFALKRYEAVQNVPAPLPGVGVIESLQLWLTAESENVSLDSAGRVQLWRDKSGRNNELRQSNQANRPYRVVQENLLRFTEDFSNSYWSGYWVKPAITTGVLDPFGENRATRFAGTDFNPPGNNASGINIPDSLTIGKTYTISVWLRSVSGNQNFNFGLNDTHNNTITVTPIWQRFVFSATATTISRGFQLYENGNANQDWEIAFPQLIEGSFNLSTIPSYVPNLYGQNQLSNAFNNQPAISFRRAFLTQLQGSGSILNILNQPAGITTMIVLRPEEIALAPNSRMFNFSTTSGGTTKYSIRPSSLQKFEFTKRPAGQSAVAIATIGNYSISSYQLLTVIDSNTNPESIRVNGVVDTTQEIAQNYDAGTSAQFHLGSFAGFTDAFEGEIAEILMFNEELSGTTLTAVENYLKTKYNI